MAFAAGAIMVAVGSAPAGACAAWLVFSSGAMGGNAQWVTVPLGLAILTVAALWVLIAAVGLVALLVASFLEQGKAAAR